VRSPDDGDKNVFYVFVVKRSRQMVVIDNIVTLVRPENNRDHVLAAASSSIHDRASACAFP
jgi:hypothetical protein